MSGTVLENVLVREYLRGLSLECVSLPVAQARELREQIAAHLDEALAPDATNAEVQAERPAWAHRDPSPPPRARCDLRDGDACVTGSATSAGGPGARLSWLSQ